MDPQRIKKATSLGERTSMHKKSKKERKEVNIW
jgi:hypothetical protein